LGWCRRRERPLEPRARRRGEQVERAHRVSVPLRCCTNKCSLRPSFYDRRVLVAAPPPAWIQRAPIPPPIVAWRLADVLGTPEVEGIAVDLDRTAGTLTVNVVDSRPNPPHIAKLREVN